LFGSWQFFVMSTNYLTKMVKDVNRAISDLIGGAQSATVSTPSGSRSYTRARLPELMAWRTQLYREISIANVRKRVRPDFS
jgi:hypothetical protein